jgi:hypothetical protein
MSLHEEILENPNDQNVEGEIYDENPQAQEELKELAQNTRDGFSRLVISAKILTSDEMMEQIRTFKEKKPNFPTSFTHSNSRSYL